MKSPAAPAASALHTKYGLQPAPQCIARLTQLVARRTSDNMELIAKVVASDPALRQRLLRAATTKKNDPVEDVSRALFRCGVEAVVALAMADPLVRAVQRTFDELLGFELEMADEFSILAEDVIGLRTIVEFSGKASGKVYVRMRRDFGRIIAARLLVGEPQDMTDTDITDAVGELANTIVGNFKSNLCDAGLSCRLSVPRVEDCNTPPPATTAPGRHQAYGFLHQDQPMLVNIVVDSTQ
jgi:CheY-specific phosphatase CheX